MIEDERLIPQRSAVWQLPRTNEMKVPGKLIADTETAAQLLKDEDEGSQWSALGQLRNVASLPGIVRCAIALPDVHPGYGFPIGGVAAFDPDEGVAVVGGVGFDINCGVRLLATPLPWTDLAPQLEPLGEDLFRSVPAGLGARGRLQLSISEMDAVLRDGAAWAVARGYGRPEDLSFCEEHGRMPGADPRTVSLRAKQRQFQQMGTLGAGNHYLEIQRVETVLDPAAAETYGLFLDQIVVSIHTGSRALGHQIGQDALKEMAAASERYGLSLPQREMACAPISSPEGERFLAAVACGANCALANRQMIGDLVRRSLHRILGLSADQVRTVYDVGHNNAKFETHLVDGVKRRLLVHRKGATRAFGAGREETPDRYRSVGHPTFVGGTMGTASYVLRGTTAGMSETFGSGIHGAGRALSRKKAAKKFWAETIVSQLLKDGITLWTHSLRGIAEEAPGAYKDIEAVVGASVDAGITHPVARLRPVGVIKG
jgi:tRNA-splicing ligase RtcB (3'-phosphate/5'-hydroxy nucleic acid ligase)